MDPITIVLTYENALSLALMEAIEKGERLRSIELEIRHQTVVNLRRMILSNAEEEAT